MVTKSPVASADWRPPSDDGYDDFLAAVRKRFDKLTAQSEPLFTTATDGLFELFLAALPDGLRQENTCDACRRFVARFGGLVTIDEHGKTSSVLWSAKQGPEPYASAASALADAVARAPVVGVFLTGERKWGVASKGGWTHLAITPTSALVFPTGPRNAEQAAAEARENFRLLVAGLGEYPLKLVQQAVSLLDTGKLYRSEKCISVAKWLVGVHKSLKSAGSARTRENLLWRAVATAPPGFCHVRSTMIGTLLDDLKNQLPFAEIKARFDQKMHPLQYQRPTAPPGQQNIERAEKIVAQLQSARALERRFAKLDDIDPLWLPTGRELPREGVFAHIKARSRTADATTLDAPPVVMTWEKFARTVLPEAAAIHYRVPTERMGYAALVTAKHPDAPPILQWDSQSKRNPVSWYMYVKGSPPEAWNLRADTHHPVVAITLSPPMWGGSDKHSHQGKMVFFLLEGAKDLHYERGGGLFPSNLRSEYHEIRATVEAHTKDAVIEGKREAEACGLALRQNGSWGASFRVTSMDGVVVTYQLDRWD
ncbi:MAG TPA: hypothetical protein VM869_07300 [Enhygromyxa sp.]|nr:hypothetical protein [Enhygromyxa sp.]